jgi:hypothetical protein
MVVQAGRPWRSEMGIRWHMGAAGSATSIRSVASRHGPLTWRMVPAFERAPRLELATSERPDPTSRQNDVVDQRLVSHPSD